MNRQSDENLRCILAALSLLPWIHFSTLNATSTTSLTSCEDIVPHHIWTHEEEKKGEKPKWEKSLNVSLSLFSLVWKIVTKASVIRLQTHRLGCRDNWSSLSKSNKTAAVSFSPRMSQETQKKETHRHNKVAKPSCRNPLFEGIRHENIVVLQGSFARPQLMSLHMFFFFLSKISFK